MTEETVKSVLPTAPTAIQRVEHVDSVPMLSLGIDPQMQALPHGPGLLHVLWQRRLIVLVSVLLAVAGGVGYLYYATPIYSSSSRIYVHSSGPKIMSADEAGAGRSTNLNTECQVIMSGPILAAALNSPGIKDLPTFSGDSSAFASLAAGLAVTAGKSDDLITVSFESPYSADVPQVVNAVVDAYLAYQSSRKKSTAAEVLKVLQKEKLKRDGELEEAAKDLLDYKQKNPALGFQGEKGNIIVQRLDRLSSALTEAELELVQVRSSYEAVLSLVIDSNVVISRWARQVARESLSPMPWLPAYSPVYDPDLDIPERLPKGTAARVNQLIDAKYQAAGAIYVSTQQDEESVLRAELNGLHIQMQSLKLSYSSGHFTIDRVEKRIAEVEQLIAASQEIKATSRLSAIRQQFDAARKMVASVKSDYDSQMKAALALNSTLADYAKIEYRWEGLKKLVEQLDGRIKELNVTEDVGAMNINVLETAGKPVLPIKPRKVQIAGMSVAIGVLLGIGLAMLRSWTDRRVTSADEVSGILGVPVVGTLPRTKKKASAEDQGIDVLDDPSSSTAEAYRGIRTTLGFSLRGLRAKTVLVTSPLPQDGKSTFASNLAFSMAQAGQRVLIVDADLRQPRQHSILSMDNSVGLANVLAGEVPLAKAIQPFDSRAVHVLPAGRTGEHSYEMLNSTRMADVLRELAELYDFILIDSPPLMSVTDPLVLAAICDVTVLVVRAGWSDRRAAELAREGLLSVGARVVGAVVTGIKSHKGRYHRYYNGYYDGPRKNGGSPPESTVAAGPKAEPDGK